MVQISQGALEAFVLRVALELSFPSFEVGRIKIGRLWHAEENVRIKMKTDKKKFLIEKFFNFIQEGPVVAIVWIWNAFNFC